MGHPALPLSPQEEADELRLLGLDPSFGTRAMNIVDSISNDPVIAQATFEGDIGVRTIVDDNLDSEDSTVLPKVDLTLEEQDEIRDRHLRDQERVKRIEQEQRAAIQARGRAARILSNRNRRKRRGGW